MFLFSVQIKVVFTGNVLQVRYRKAIYPRKYVEPDFVRKQMLAVCEPVFPRDKRQPSLNCYNLGLKYEREIHPFDKLLAEDMKRELSSSRMICFLHTNVLTNREKKEFSNLFEHQNMYLRYYNEDVAQLAMAGTKYQSALHLCHTSDWVVQQKDVTILFSGEPQVTKLLKLMKKCPQLILLAAIIDDRFLSVDHIKDYNRLPDLQTLRTQLSYTLSLATKSIADKTVYPISSLTNSIDLYIKDMKKVQN